jgi:hypothetical protein
MCEVQTAGGKRRNQQDGRDNDFLLHDRSLSQIKGCFTGWCFPSQAKQWVLSVPASSA